VVIPIASRHQEYSQEVRDLLRAQGIRAEVDSRSEKMNAKIRDAETQKIPFILIVGDREVESRSVSVRRRKKGDLGAMPLSQLIEKMVEEIQKKAIEPLD
jgi:threonyl-tRNA synthetase